MARFLRTLYDDDDPYGTAISDLPGFPSRWSIDNKPKESLHRYTLWRVLDSRHPDLGYIQFIGLNPSTADDVQNDPTVTRCINYARKWGFFAFCMTNIFAFRATDPKDMYAAVDPIGRDNDMWLLAIAKRAKKVICAWGTHGAYLNRGLRVAHKLKDHGIELHCLGRNNDYSPKHPLYLRADQEPEIYKL